MEVCGDAGAPGAPALLQYSKVKPLNVGDVWSVGGLCVSWVLNRERV